MGVIEVHWGKEGPYSSGPWCFKAMWKVLMSLEADVLSTHLALPTPQLETSWAPLQSWWNSSLPQGLQHGSVLSFPFFLSLSLSSVSEESGPHLQLPAERGINVTKLICTMKYIVMKAWPLWSEVSHLPLDLGKTTSTSNTVSYLAFSHLDLSKIHAVTLINYFSL